MDSVGVAFSRPEPRYIRSKLVNSALMRTIISLAAAGLIGMSVVFAEAAPSAPSNQYAIERKYDSLIHREEMRDWMKLLAAEPNHVGSPHDKANAERILAW